MRGSHLEGVVLQDAASSRPLRRTRMLMEPDKGYYHVLGQIHKLVEVLSAEIGMRPHQLGVAIPGHLDPITKTLKQSGLEAFDNKPLGTDLNTYLGLDIKLASGAQCMTLAETRFGVVPSVLPGAKCVFGVLIDEHVEGGIVINGRVLTGRQGIAGSFGHSYLDAKGGACWCGKHGCVDTVLAVPALEHHYAEIGGGGGDISAVLRDGPVHGNSSAELCEHLVYNLAKALGPVINLLDPEAVVIGGPGAQSEVIFEQLTTVLKRFVHNTRIDTLVLRPKLGRHTVAIGAALL